MHIGRPGSRARPRLLYSTGAPRQVGNLTNQAVHRTADEELEQGQRPEAALALSGLPRTWRGLYRRHTAYVGHA